MIKHKWAGEDKFAGQLRDVYIDGLCYWLTANRLYKPGSGISIGIVNLTYYSDGMLCADKRDVKWCAPPRPRIDA